MPCDISYICLSHVGKRRRLNQDNIVCNGIYRHYENSNEPYISQGKLSDSKAVSFGIFDGMGGGEHGEIAAYLAAQSACHINWTNDIVQDLQDYIENANEAICRYAAEHSVCNMGTTVAMVVVHKKIFFCNIGDSRIFRFSGNKLKQVSYDDVSSSFFGRKPTLTQCLGTPKEELILEPHIFSQTYRKNDIYLLCSDGLTDMVSEECIREIMMNSVFENIGQTLMNTALNNGGKDNISIIVFKITDKRIIVWNI